jgi:hypothetical protein
MNIVDISKLKNRISELIAIYLFEFKKQDECGGDLHVILEDGNVDNESIEICRKWCVESNDIFGVLICDTLLLLGERRRWNLYLKNWGIPKEYEEKFDRCFSKESIFSFFQLFDGR